MMDLVELLGRAVIIGVAAAALMDGWGVLARRAFGIQGLDYALLGRWIGHIPRGRLVHKRIAAAAPIPGERLLGWVAHYSIGVAFAIPLLVFWGPGWAHAPTIGPALIVGVGTVLAPWFVMQPAMGAGIAASHTANPTAARLRNIAMHTVYAVGLYGSGVALAAIWP